MTAALETLRNAWAAGRRILIFGVGSQGRGLQSALADLGLPAAGFVDSNPVLHNRLAVGLPVYPPEGLAEPGASQANFVIVASFFFERELCDKLDRLGFVQGRDYLPYSALKPHDYAVEVSGVCNLRCISCPRSTRSPHGRNARLMDIASFQKVIAKIRREAPFVGNIQLYQWGEPTLNRALPEMIRHARDNGIVCSISSNLNSDIDWGELIKARPECLRLSTSGIEGNYEITHTGGKWRIFLERTAAIASLRGEHFPDMKVELYYHRYRHSVGEQQERMAELARQYDFEFHPVPAYIISLDDVLAYSEGKPLPPTAQAARELLLIDIDEGLRLAREQAHLECDALRTVLVNADLSVSACMMFYDEQNNTLAANYLETPVERLDAARAYCALCHRCRAHGVHRYCKVYAMLGEEERY